MEAVLNTSVVLLPLAYLFIVVDYGFLFFAGRSFSPRSASLSLRVVLALHFLYLVGLTLKYRQFPAASVSQALSIVAFSVLAVYTFLEWHGKERSTGFWMVSLAFVFSLLSSLMAGPVPDRELFHDPFFFAHASMALLGYASFAVAASYGFLFLRLYQELKAGRFSVFFGKLPPLEVLERMLRGALIVGFVALTLAVGLGFGWALQVLEGAWYADPKILATLATWTLYAGTLILQRLRRWRGREMAVASLAGLAAVLFSIFAVNLWLSDFHTFL